MSFPGVPEILCVWINMFKIDKNTKNPHITRVYSNNKTKTQAEECGKQMNIMMYSQGIASSLGCSCIENVIYSL